ncbi:MAG TPA: hypothetical protein VKZ59_06070 [Acidobacteriota bacterium]|nr:hypothetical protein [Acidobacteriota bacterium]
MQGYHKQERHFTVGLDLSDKKSYYVILDYDGEVVEEGKVATTTKAGQTRLNLDQTHPYIEATSP